MKSNSIPIPGSRPLTAVDEDALAHTWAHNLRVSSSTSSSEGETQPDLQRPDSASPLPQGSLSPEARSPVVLRPPEPLATDAQPGQLCPALSKWVEEGDRAGEMCRRRAAHQIQKCLSGHSTALHLGELQLAQLPALVWSLVDLTELHLGKNALTHLPREIGNLTKLTHLALCDNKLTVLPSSIRNLTELQILDLSANWLYRLPEGIESLRSLRWFYLCENPMAKPDPLLSRLHEDCMIFLGARAGGDVEHQSAQTFPGHPNGPYILFGG